MPIKGFKGFTRRKSVGNALDDPALAEAPLVSSFRVLERPHEPSKSFDGGHHLTRNNGESRPVSEGRQGDEADRRPQPNRYATADRTGHRLANGGSGSSGTQNSVSSNSPYNSSSSAHHSSTSTLPTAYSDWPREDQAGGAKGKNLLPHTNTAPPGFFRTAFPGRKTTTQALPTTTLQIPQPHVNYANIPDVYSASRPRLTTDSSHTSDSTVTPTGYSSLDARKDADDDFSNMFAGISGSNDLGRFGVESSSEQPQFSTNSAGPRISGYRTSASQPVSPAVYSPVNVSSRDGPLGTGRKAEVTSMRRKPSPQSTGQPWPMERNRTTPSPGFTQSPHSRNASGTRERSLIPSGATPSPKRQPSPHDPLLSFANEDVELAMRYIDQSDSPPSPALPAAATAAVTVEPFEHAQPPRPRSQPISVEPLPTSVIDYPSPDKTDAGSIMTTPKHAEGFPMPVSAGLEDAPEEDASMQEIALYADRLEEREKPPPPKPKPVNAGKVMTPAQFERYKKEQEQRQLVEGSDSESEKEESDKEDEDDEQERNREMARQRRKQEADLAVYRQKMMKLTGETVGMPRTDGRNPSSTMNIPTINLDGSGSGATSEEDEDENVPLGILAAHGFPNKNRPPSQLDGGRGSVQYASETYPAPRVASAMSEAGMASKSVPAFAKNLPRDPFYGASLVTPTDRQSLAFGSRAASVRGGSQAGSVHGGAAPAGGLVGVIAKEERARAMRRGSPNTGFAESNAASGLAMPFGAGSTMAPSASAEQAQQMQMTQQMHQMMQMQMQWMQQMMQMQQSMGSYAGGMPPMPPMPGMVPHNQAGGAPLPQRPVSRYPTTSTPNLSKHASMRPSTATGVPLSSAQSATFPLSYAPSLAPSERSTIGQPSRYRPVSTMPTNASGPDGGAAGGSAGGSGGINNSAASSPGGSPRTGPITNSAKNGHLGLPPALKTGSTLGPLSRPASSTPLRPRPRARADDDDEEDDAGWAAMQAARNRKRGTWKAANARAASRLGASDEVHDGEAELAGLAGVLHYAEN